MRKEKLYEYDWPHLCKITDRYYLPVLNLITGTASDLASKIGEASSHENCDNEGEKLLEVDKLGRHTEDEQRQGITADGGMRAEVGSFQNRAEEAGDSDHDLPNNNAHIVVAIPAYNEQNTIGSVVRQADRYADTTIVVDDGSHDKTVPRARAAGATVIEHDQNRGYGAALQTAFLEAATRSVDHLIILDGDNQHEPKDIPKLLTKQQETGAEVVIGSRFIADIETDIPIYRHLGLEVVNLLTNLAIGITDPKSRITDTQSGFRSYTGEAVQTLATDWTISDHMGASIDILYSSHQWNYHIEEVETTIVYDVENSSNQNPIIHGFMLVVNLLKILKENRTKIFYEVISLSMVLVAFVVWMWENSEE